MADTPINIVIAGGGTGGHLFPGIAIAQTFLSRNPENSILFVGTDRPFERTILATEGFEHRFINAAGIKGMGLFSKLKSAMKIPGAVLQSARILARFKPSIIIGVGGYSSGPVALAAFLMRTPVVLHEQNSVAGITNRILSRIARRVYVSFPESADGFPESKVQLTGNPVRQAILSIDRQKIDDEKPFTILVAGGSQGARAINAAVCDALPRVSTDTPVEFIHQTGEADEAMVRDTYDKQSIPATVKAFYSDMDRQYERADLIICRAGATTIAEITAMGHSAILIPFPHAADNHQEKNARSLVTTNAAEMITEDVLSGELLADKINGYATNPDRLSQLAENARAWGKRDAAATIVDDCYDLIFNRIKG